VPFLVESERKNQSETLGKGTSWSKSIMLSPENEGEEENSPRFKKSPPFLNQLLAQLSLCMKKRF